MTPIHRDTEVAVGILDSALGAGSDGLVVVAQVGVEAAVVDPGSRLVEDQLKLPGLAAIVVGPLRTKLIFCGPVVLETSRLTMV